MIRFFNLAALILCTVSAGCSRSVDQPADASQNAIAGSMTVPPANEAAGAQEASSEALASTRVAIGDRASRGDVSRPATVKVAAIQCSSSLGDVAGNRAKLTELIQEAAGIGAKIIVLPETAITGYLSQDLQTNWHVLGRPKESRFRSKDPTEFAEKVPGLSTKHFCELAKQLQIYLTIPLLEIDDSMVKPESDLPMDSLPRFFNTVCLASPEGKLVAHYRKLTPWPYPEKSWATPGDRGVQVYDSEYGRMGLAICYDIHTILERYEPHKIWALLYPIAWVDENHPADWFWHRLPKRIAPFNHYVIGANWSVDERQNWYGYGFSTIFDRDGTVLATAKSLYGPEILYATIETEKL